MSENKDSKNCGPRKKAMLAYGLIQLSATVVSALSLLSIAIGLCSIKAESKLFNECVEEMIESGSDNANAVRFCNGG